MVLDTHAWVWWMGRDARVPAPARRALEQEETFYISAMSVMELSCLVRRDRVRLAMPYSAWLPAALDARVVTVIPMDSDVARRAGELPWDHGDPADRVVVATAAHLNVPLVTADARIRRSGLVPTVWS